MRPTFGRAYLEEQLERIGEGLTDPLTVHLIGGGALALRDLKAATKDVDLVVQSSDAFGRLWGVLQAIGFEEVQSPDPEYRALGASCCAENEDGCRFDVFDRQVADRLVLSAGMRERSEQFLETAPLDVRVVSNDDIFLFKSVAGRDDDIEDMNVLVQAGLDFGVIERELDAQIERLGDDQFVTYANEALLDLEAEYGVSTPVHDRVAELTDRYYLGLELLHELDGPATVAELASTLEVDETTVTDRVSYLESFDRVAREGDVVHRLGG